MFVLKRNIELVRSLFPFHPSVQRIYDTRRTDGHSVTEIESQAFHNCSGLNSVTIPGSVKVIGTSAFEDCEKLTSVTLQDGVTYIGSAAFRRCYGLSSIMIPSSVTVISEAAFYESGLTSVDIPNGVTSLGYFAFSGTKLTNLRIPASVTSLGECVFSYCSDLSYISVDANNLTFDSRKGCAAIIETSSNTLRLGCMNTVIPEDVWVIGSYAFAGCSGLSWLVIPSSVISIGSDAFAECTELTTLITKSETPPNVYDDTFERLDLTTCTLYVPKGCKSVYENAAYWGEFENIVEIGKMPDTYISALDNAIYLERTDGLIGSTMDLSVKMKNNFDVQGFQFTMELPEGTTINSWRLNTQRLPEGATLSNKISYETIHGNKISVFCVLNYGDATFTGNDGEIATVNVTFANDMEADTYPIFVTDCDLADIQGTNMLLSKVKSTLVLYVKGDANGDNQVRIGDATAVLNYIVGNVSDNFNVKAADVNGDGDVRIGDVTAVLNLIVNQ